MPEAKRSGAYNLVKDFHINTLTMEKILRDWYKRGVDRNGYEPRGAICSNIVDNIEQIKLFAPQGYPCNIRCSSHYDHRYIFAAMILGTFAIISNLVTATLIYHLRKKKVIQYAQPEFIILVLTGILMIVVGAIVSVTEISLATCVAKQWLVTLGYSVELTPLIV